jgi:nitrile hydratase accessory protein
VTASADPGYALDVHGPAAPPRSNGELVFTAPWESRAFGLAMALADGGVFAWESFREVLIARIADFEAAHPDGAGWSYYACWVEALEGVLTTGVLDSNDVRRRLAELAARPAGYDHGHDHEGHGHGHGHGH